MRKIYRQFETNESCQEGRLWGKKVPQETVASNSPDLDREEDLRDRTEAVCLSSAFIRREGMKVMGFLAFGQKEVI
jgi:hypothetical protein